MTDINLIRNLIATADGDTILHPETCTLEVHLDMYDGELPLAYASGTWFFNGDINTIVAIINS